MIGSDLQILNTQLLGGQQLDETLFYQLVNMKKDILEMSRDWMILRSTFNDAVFTAADDYEARQTLPERFLRTYAFYDSLGQLRGPYILTDAGAKVDLKPIKFAERYDYKDTEGYYYIDMKDLSIGRTGSTAGTLYLPYLQGSVDINADNEWEFPSFAHPMLAYEVAVEQKGGIDWDTINANQVPYNRDTSRNIMSALAMWDARLQQAELGV